jgi:hypothetical protein
MTDEVTEELSSRCKRLLIPKLLIAQTIFGEHYKELKVGRVVMREQGELLKVELYRLDYTFTTDTVYIERNGRHSSSSWPSIEHALSILRNHMILDDLADALG